MPIAGAVVLGCTVTVGAQTNADWPQWRGPIATARAVFRDADSVAGESDAAMEGRHRSRVCDARHRGHRVYTFSRRDENEVVAALDVTNGKQYFATQYPAPYTLVKAAAGHGMGRSRDPHLPTAGSSPSASAHPVGFDAATGKLLWQKPRRRRVGPTFIRRNRRSSIGAC